jgi:hypothetical protein
VEADGIEQCFARLDSRKFDPASLTAQSSAPMPPPVMV